MFEINEMQKVPLDNRIIGSIMCGLFSIEIFWNCIFLSEFKMMVTIHVAKDERIAENN